MVRRREGTNWGPVCLVALMALDFGRVINLAWPDLTCSAPARPGATGRRPGCVRLPVRPAASGFEWGPERHGPSPGPPFLARALAVPRAVGPAAYGICKRGPVGPGLRSHDKAARDSELARAHHGLINYQSRRNVMTFSTCFVCGNMSNGVQSRTR